MKDLNLSTLTDDDLLKLYKNTRNEISVLDTMQYGKKILINSCYGALSNEWFRWYDDDLAESVTYTGQLTIKWVGNRVNEFLNKTFNTQNIDYIIASDTDSLYLNLEKAIDKNLSDDDKIDALDAFVKNNLDSVIKTSFEDLCSYTNAFENKLSMKREIIADKGLWVAKKRYALDVRDKEGIRYSEPKLKVSGIEIVRSDTPEFNRKKLKEALTIVLRSSEKDLWNFIEKTKKEFMELPFEDIAFPSGINGLNTYFDVRTIYTKGTPIHVRAALLYNFYIKKNGLDKEYQLIKNGDKIKFAYLLMPNSIKENVIACQTVLPKELNIHKYIDYHTQFEKSFIQPLSRLTEIVGWTPERRATLRGIF